MLKLFSFDSWRRNEVRWVLAVLALLTLIGSFEAVNQLLGYDRQLFESGQVWRPVSAWIAQLNSRHWLLNQWGLIVLVILLPKTLSRPQWLGFAVILVLSSLMLAVSDYDNYVGLSGVLYGWLVFAAVLSPFYSRWVKLVFIGCLTAKVLSENGYVPLPNSDWVADFIDGQVAHESHLWGLLSGYCVFVARWIALQFLKRRALHG